MIIKMIRLDVNKKIVIIDTMTSLDTVIMLISANHPDLNNWKVVPFDQVDVTEEENDELPGEQEDEQDDTNPKDYFR